MYYNMWQQSLTPLILIFHLEAHLLRSAHKKGFNRPAEQYSWRAPDKIHPVHMVETKAEAQEAKKLFSKTRLFPHIFQLCQDF